MSHFLTTRIDAHDQETQEFVSQVVGMLETAYFAELETAMNYIAMLNNLSGVDAEPVKEILRGEIDDEFRHAQELANRIRVLGFKVPSAWEFRSSRISLGQEKLSKGGTLNQCIEAVVAAESEAMTLYKEIIDLSAEKDPVTADLVTNLLADEEDHFRTFSNLL
jgi:bacterioferritin